MIVEYNEAGVTCSNQILMILVELALVLWSKHVLLMSYFLELVCL